MSRYAVLIALLAAFIALSSCGDQIPTMPTSAGKVAVEEEPQSYIVWECGADEWTDAADSTWTIFFHGQFRLYLEGTTVEISEYISSSSKLVYEPGEPGRPGFTLYAYGSWCAATTELIGTEIPDIRIWRGDVDWLYRNDPQHSRYVLYENDLVYHIASIEEDDAVGYIDFESFHNRNNPRPMLEAGSRAVWPVNVDEVKRDSLEVLGQVPTDDRPYLLDVVCQGAECPDFVQDIELQDQLVRGFEEKQAPQSPITETVRNVQEQDGTQEPKATEEIVQGEEVPPAPTTTIIYARTPPPPPGVEFVSQEETELISARQHTPDLSGTLSCFEKAMARLNLGCGSHAYTTEDDPRVSKNPLSCFDSDLSPLYDPDSERSQAECDKCKNTCDGNYDCIIACEYLGWASYLWAGYKDGELVSMTISEWVTHCETVPCSWPFNCDDDYPTSCRE